MRSPSIKASLLAIVALVVAALPVAAQETAPTLEGTQWSLVSYADSAGTTDLPLGVEASLLLEDGVASGSSGCNSYSGSYSLEAASLSFGDEFTMTLRFCDGDAGAVETAYLEALAEVAAWSIDGAGLELLDRDAQTVLTYDASTPVTLSVAEMARLVERIETLEAQVARSHERIDNISISKLRERIRTLESETAALRSQVAQLRSSASRPEPAPTTGFNAAEKVLLRGVPERFHNRCQPLRNSLPAGTAAAVQCRPNTVRVAEMAYYLMEADPAATLFNDKMIAAGVDMWGDIVPEGVELCTDGAPSSIAAGGGYIGMEGCYRQSGVANVRVVEQLTSCQQLTAGGTRLERPVMYVALSGPNADIKSLYGWSTRGSVSHLSPLIVPLGDTGEADSPDCFSP